MFISIVSHNHSNLIYELDNLKLLAQYHDVIVTDNTGEDSLKRYCNTYGIHYISNPVCKGFGENNNQNFYYAKEKLGMKSEDYFLVLNPDVSITNECLEQASQIATKNNSEISTINLIKGDEIFDYNIRKFPSFFDFMSSYIFGINKTTIDKSAIKDDIYVDWASGSFLLFKAEIYESIKGFDIEYFMYCEDLDICKRINIIYNKKVLYMHAVRALHIAAHKNRQVFSKHFLWHIKSVLRYCFFSKY